jgi:hypothetical protein
MRETGTGQQVAQLHDRYDDDDDDDDDGGGGGNETFRTKHSLFSVCLSIHH